MTVESMVRAAQPLIGAAEQEAVARVLASGALAQGAEVAAFEAEFAATAVTGRPCVAVNSGTSALLLGMIAAGIGPGDEVIVPSFTFAASANAVVLTGARPVFVDIEPEHFCLDPAAVLAAITPRTAAIMPVHLYGHPAAMDRLLAIAQRTGVGIVEDAAQAHLASFGGRPVGTFGQIGIFSFYPTKNMTTAEGGMVVCADEQLARRVRLLRNQGMERRYENECVGYNARMSELHAAIGRVQLRRLTGWTAQRCRNAAYLTSELTDLDSLETPRMAPAAEHVWHQYTVRVPHRDRVAADLAALGVSSGVYYPTPVHQLPAYHLDLDLPETRLASQQVLSLPVHPALTDAELDTVVQAVRKCVPGSLR